MFPRHRPTSRYERALLRRRALRSLAAAGVIATTTACGDNDAAVFEGAVILPEASTTISTTSSTTTTTTTIEPDVATTVPPAADNPAVPPAESTTTVAPTTTPDPAEADVVVAATAFPEGGELVVDFTFTPTSSGERITNPYIAVWVEDLDGNLIDTISLWHQSGGRGARWLRTLRQWSDATDQLVDSTSSGPTRRAGTYAVAWDGLDSTGTPIEPGVYRLLVEAAREDGPYELSTTEVAFVGTEFVVALPNDGELFDISARLVA